MKKGLSYSDIACLYNALRQTKNWHCVGAAAMATAIFISINCLIACTYGLAKEFVLAAPGADFPFVAKLARHINLGDEVAIDSAVTEFTQRKRHPDVVIMGSSLMIYPFWSTDMDFDPIGTTPNVLRHHRANVLQNKLQESGCAGITVDSLATPLQMVSDAYFYAWKYLRGPHKPRVLVLGLSPRDFFDADFASSGSTLNFNARSNLWVDRQCVPLYLPSWTALADYAWCRISFLYDKRSYIRRYFLQRFCQDPSVTMAHGTQCANGLNKYKRRYRNISRAQLMPQMTFLNRLSKLCHDREIRLVVVNMPLPAVHMQLFPPHFYDQFTLELDSSAKSNRFQLLDLGHSREFPETDYCDVAHMNKLGGYSLTRELLPVIVRDIRLASDSCLHSKQMIDRRFD